MRRSDAPSLYADLQLRIPGEPAPRVIELIADGTIVLSNLARHRPARVLYSGRQKYSHERDLSQFARHLAKQVEWSRLR